MACAGTETGNPSNTGKLGYDAYSSALSVALAGSDNEAPQDAPPTNVQATWLDLGQVDFIAGTTCKETRSWASGLGIGDHVGGQAEPADFNFIEGQYCAVRLPLVQSDNAGNGAPSAFPGHSLIVSGTLGDGRAFELRSNLRNALLMKATHGFTLDMEQSAVLIGFDLAYWLDGLPWQEAKEDADGKVIADGDQNSELLQAFEARLSGGVSLFRDADGDGLIDETRVVLAHGVE